MSEQEKDKRLPAPFSDTESHDPLGIKGESKTQGRRIDIGRSDLEGPSASSLEEGSMLMGPDHPYFANRQGNPIGGENVPRGDPRFFPSGAVPPGARFDPISPFSGPGNEPITGEPDSDEMLPPGSAPLYPGRPQKRPGNFGNGKGCSGGFPAMGRGPFFR